ncbi:hypothetical protein N7526_009770 [Penicillium atrosanguineum]|nr:hypothetical protein N7526_009770 [Penicillium atrosanguineum]
MGNVASRLDDAGSLFSKDQNRFSIASVTISNSRRRLLTLSPNAFPAVRYIAKRDPSDECPIEYIQDPDVASSTSAPTFLLRLSNDDELIFNFTFILRQTKTGNVAGSTVNGVSTSLPEVADTTLTGLTFAHASNSKELDNLITREFHANPNLQNNSNVQLIGGLFDRSPQLSSPNLELPVPRPRSRVPSTQSTVSHLSDTEIVLNHHVPSVTPPESADGILPPPPTVPPPPPPVKVDLPYSRPGDDMGGVEDGPLFRATMKAMEQKTGNMRTKIKKVLKKAEAAQQAQATCNDAMEAFLGSLNDASTSNANAIQPALDHYFEKIARQIQNYEHLNTLQLQKLVIEPLIKLYNNDIKQAESKKKEFDEESRDYYAYVSRYLGQRQDSLKEKKRVESDSKYQVKRRNFELKRFDYSSFMQDLHGGRKEQEVLSHLTKYADFQAKNFLAAAKKVDEMVPQLDALIHEVTQADKEFQFKRTEREEKRRALEKNSNPYLEPDVVAGPVTVASTSLATANGGASTDAELGRADSTGSQLRGVISNSSSISSQANAGSVGSSAGVSAPTTSAGSAGASSQNRFKGIRDLEERDTLGFDQAAGQQRKEGLLWALSRPGSHIDPKGINKQAWHKFWIVLDQGKLSEYSNWKQKLDLHMEPIDLRMASVREARNAERRFCFEVITPQFKRIYQATSEEDMANWIRSINNALQSAVEGRGLPLILCRPKSNLVVVTSALFSRARAHRYLVTTDIQTAPATVNSYEENPSRLLQLVRDADEGNKWCADCGSSSKVEWVSINLGIVLCIECSGIHRSLGTHISKIRSLTLDVHSFSNDIVEILLQIGNRVSNMIWEATLDQSVKPSAGSTREQRLKFITAKYVDRSYVEHLPSPRSRFATPDETLLASIKRNDIQGVLYGIALRANTNVADRSRNTHAVFLALAAADPASPGSTPTTPISSRPAPKAIPFPVAELLVQNGADIPPQPPSIPLSSVAQLYLSQRTSRASAFTPPTPGPVPGKVTVADSLGSLPTIRASGKDSTSSSSAQPSSSLDSKEKEKEKLSKRGSAGARFAGKVASLGIDR